MHPYSHSYYDPNVKGSGFSFFEDSLPDSAFFDEADALPDEVFEEAERFALESDKDENLVNNTPAPKPVIAPKPIPAPAPKPSFYEGDVSDEIFDASERFAKNTQPDRIENITGQIFLHLISLTDGTNHEELEAAFTTENERPSSPSENKSHTHRFRPFERETHFSDFDLDQQPVHTQHVMSKIAEAITQIFLGWQLSEDAEGQRSLDDMKMGLKRDFLTWSKLLKQHYDDILRKQMECAFKQAENLLETREADEQWAGWQRLVFYSSLLSLGASTLAGKHTFMILSGAVSSITVIFMVVHYGNSSLKQAQQASDLKSLVATIYSGAHQYRINPQTMDHLEEE